MLSLPFTARGHQGEVTVTVTENDNPVGVGQVPAASGFPMCRATVEYEGVGYLAVVELLGPHERRSTAAFIWWSHSE